MFRISGMTVHVVPSMTIVVGEDWSKVRSPSRARRRRRKHRQNIVTLYRPDPQLLVDQERQVIYCHPATAEVLMREAQKRSGLNVGYL